VDSFLGGLYVGRAELAGYLVAALAQLDADEALMRRALVALDGERGKRCDRETVSGETITLLRTRLGDPAPEDKT